MTEKDAAVETEGAILPRTAERKATDGGQPAVSAVRRTRESIWLVFGAASAVLLVIALLKAAAFGGNAPGHLRVFGSFWASGWAAAHGQNPFGVYPLTWAFHDPHHAGLIVDRNLNPPSMLPFFQALAWLSPDTAARVWTMASALLWIGSGGLLVWAYRDRIQHRQIIWFLLAQAVFNTLWLGQNYALFVALAVGAWLLLERDRTLPAGICLGLLAATKPNYGLWILLLFFCGRRKAAMVAAATAAVFCLLPVALYGPGIYLEWMRTVAADPHWFLPNDISVAGVLSRFGHHLLGVALAALLLAGTCAFVVWKRPSLRNTSGIALSVGILASPLAWYHYAMLLAGPLLSERWGILLSLALLVFMLHVPGLAYFGVVCFVAAYFFRRAAVERPAPAA
jgi:hypothetical protein